MPQFRGKIKVLKFLDKKFGPLKMNARFGIVLKGYYSSLQDCAFLRSISENETLEKSIDNLPANGIFIDIGANSGYCSALASKKLSKKGAVISFEPSFREYSRLLWAIQNNLHHCQWIPMNLALGNDTGIVKLDVSSSHTGVNYVITNNDYNGQYCYLNKAEILLQNLLPNGKIIDLIKIDVEGYEMSVLQGLEHFLKMNIIQTLQIEITDDFLRRAGASKEKLYNYLTRFGYQPMLNSSDWQYNEIFKLIQ
jgi:FkbM family methyltransferase